MRVIVCGGREYTDLEGVKRVLNAFHAECPITYLIHGGQTGADSLGAYWAYQYAKLDGARVIEYKADWDTHGKKAGALRNIAMIEHGKGELVIAFPGGPGTDLMMRIAIERGIPVLYVNPELGTAKFM